MTEDRVERLRTARNVASIVTAVCAALLAAAVLGANIWGWKFNSSGYVSPPSGILEAVEEDEDSWGSATTSPDGSFQVMTEVWSVTDATWTAVATGWRGASSHVLISFKNVGDKQLDNVTVSFEAPDDVVYVTGSALMIMLKYPNGVPASDGPAWNVGSYAPGGVSYMLFDLRLPPSTSTCGTESYSVAGSVTVDGVTAMNSASITATTHCRN